MKSKEKILTWELDTTINTATYNLKTGNMITATIVEDIPNGFAGKKVHIVVTEIKES